MLGNMIDRPDGLFCDNQYVTNNVTLSQSVLSKRHYEIFYHRFFEAQAKEIIRVGWIKGDYNQVCLGTNTTLSTKRRYELVNEIMWNNVFAIYLIGA